MLRRRDFGRLCLAAAGAGLVPFSAQANDMPEVLRNALERQPFSPVLGNPDGDVTLSEFFDYNCGYCKKAMPVVLRLIEEDPNLRVVLREWPIFGEGSEFAARAALAALQQDKYPQAHQALMAIKGAVNEASALRALRDIGLDEKRLARDMDSQVVRDHIYQSMDLADHMGLMGTPSFLAGNNALFGEQPLSELKKLIAFARI